MAESAVALWKAPARRNYAPHEQLIIDIDPPEGMDFLTRESAWKWVLEMAGLLADLGISLKIESVLQIYDAEIINKLHKLGVKVFADYKFSGTPMSLARTGERLAPFAPELVTVMCHSGARGLSALKAALPSTEVLGVTLLTCHDGNHTNQVYRTPSTLSATLALAHQARQAGIGVVCAPKEIEYVVKNFKNFDDTFSINVTNIREKDAAVKSDDQNPLRSGTLEEALRAGANRVVIGRPITQNRTPYDEARRYLDRINDVMAKMSKM